jgi:hypothetical protein
MLDLVVHVDGVTVSELRPLTGPLFVTQLMYEYGELRRNDINRGIEELVKKLGSVPLCPSQNPHGLTRS